MQKAGEAMDAEMNRKLDKMNDVMMDTRDRVIKLEEKVDNVNHIRETSEEALRLATEAHEKSKSSHKRLDKIDKIFFWLTTTVLGFVIVALLATVVIKGGI